MSDVSSRDWSEVTNVVGGDLGTHSDGRKYSPATLSSAFGITFRMMFKEEWRQNIDFAKNAESMGARSWNVTTPEELTRAMAGADCPPTPPGFFAAGWRD